MKVVIPVAGAGKRLRPHTHSQPKPLLPVGGKPIIAHLLDPIVKLDPEEVIFVIGYRGQQVREYVENNYSFKATFVQQDRLLGLGYAVNLAVSSIPPGELLICLGDTVVECDLQKVIDAGDNILGVLPVDDPERFGVVEIADNLVTRMVEKPDNPKSNLAIIGLYYFNDSTMLKQALADHIKSGLTTRDEVQFTDALQLMLERGVKFVPYEVQEWFDCGKKETMLATNKHLTSSRGQRPIIKGCKINPPVYINPGAEIIDSEIGPSVSISTGSKVQNSTIVNSIIGADSLINNVRLQDSLIGNEVTLKGNGKRICLIVNLGDGSQVEPC